MRHELLALGLLVGCAVVEPEPSPTPEPTPVPDDCEGEAPPPGFGVSEGWFACPDGVVRVPVEPAAGRSAAAFVHWAADDGALDVAWVVQGEARPAARTGVLRGTAFAEATTTAPGELWIRVTEDAGEPGATFGLRISEEPGCPDDGLPDGLPLPQGPVSGLRVCPGADDAFAGPLAPWSELSVAVVADAPVEVSFDGDTVTVQDDSLTLVPDGVGDVELRIAGDASYALDVAQRCRADALEPSEPDAPWPLDPSTPGDLALCDGEVDVYELASASWMGLDLQVIHDAGEGAIEAVILDEQGQAVASDAVLPDRRRIVSAGLPGPVRLELRQPVEAGAVPGNGYSLDVDAVCLPDGVEPDDDPWVAPPIPEVRTACDDVDRVQVGQAPWMETDVRVTVFEGAPLRVEALGSDGLLAAATDDAGDQVLTVPTGPIDAAWLEIEQQAAGPELSGATYELAVSHSCVAELGEPDDTPGTAGPLTAVLAQPLAVCPDDVDHRSVSLAAGERLDLRLPHDPALGDLAAALTVDGDVVARAAQQGDALRLRYEAAGAVDAVLQIDLLRDRGGVPGIGYELQLQTPSEDPCAPDSFDGADGPLPDGAVPGLSLCATDAFVVDGQAGRALSIASDPPLALELRDGGGALLADGSGSLTHTPAATGPLALTVDGTPGPYTLELTGAAPPPCVADAFEPDPSRDAAPIAGPGVLDRTLCVGDLDWLGLLGSPEDPIDVEVTWDADAGALVAELYDFAGRLLLADGADGAAQLAWAPAYLGAHWLRIRPVDPVAFEGIAYSVDVQAAGSGGDCADDAWEDNDTLADGPTMPAGPQFALQACPGDEDWYELVGEPGQSVEAEVIYHLNGGVARASLHDASGAILDAVDEPTGFDRLTASSDEPVYLRVVYESGPDSGVQYDLGLAGIGSGGPECLDDAYEPNDRPSESASLPAGDHELRLCRQQDDWFTLDAGRTAVGVVTDRAEIELGLFLQDPQGRLIGASAEAGTLQHLAATTDGSVLGVVYVQDDGREVGGAYALTVDGD